MRTDHEFIGFSFKQAQESLRKYFGPHDSLFAMMKSVEMQSDELDQGYYLTPDDGEAGQNMIIRIVR